MREIFFTARNLQDYLSHVKNIDTLNFPAEPLELPLVQKILRSLSKSCVGEIFHATKVDGLRLDFNCGLRLEVPAGNFHVVIGDFDSGQKFFERDLSDVRLISVEKHFIRWSVEIFSDGVKIFSHVLNLDGRNVLLVFDENGGMGDVLAMLPFAREFAKNFNCRVRIKLPAHLREFAARLYPDVAQIDAVTRENYATYFLAMNFGDFPTVPADIRSAPLNRLAGAILGLSTLPTKATFTPSAPPVTDEPYVCIAVQASSPTKGWHWQGGWELVVDYLKNLGYRVFCIDRENFQRDGQYTARLPENAEDFTGNFSIMERANMLYHAEFFIGLSSGPAWLAEAVGCPVVMICGFSHDWHEFYTPYRVANRLVCNGCYSDIRVRAFNNFCPHHRGTARELECQKKISPRQVLDAIERLILERKLIPPACKNYSRNDVLSARTISD